MFGSKSRKAGSYAESSLTLVGEERPRQDNASGKGLGFRIFKSPKSGRIIKRIDILREGWSNRVFKDINTNKVIYHWSFPFPWFGAHAYFRQKGPEGEVIMIAARKPFSHATTIFFQDGSEISLWPRSYLGLLEWHDFEVPEQGNWCNGSFSSVRSEKERKSGGRLMRWDGINVLKDESGVVARFERGGQRGDGDGRLEILAGGRDIVDVIVASIMILLYKKMEQEVSNDSR